MVYEIKEDNVQSLLDIAPERCFWVHMRYLQDLDCIGGCGISIMEYNRSDIQSYN